MAVLWFAGDLDGFLAGEDGSSATIADTFDPNYTDMSFRATTAGNPVVSKHIKGLPFTPKSDVWVHMSFAYGADTGNNTRMFILCNSSGNEVFRVSRPTNNNSTFIMEFYNGSTWTSIGTGFTIPDDRTHRDLDFHVSCGSSGSAEAYINGGLVDSGSITSSYVDDIAQLHLYNASTAPANNVAFYSQMIIADEQTIGWKMYTRRPTGNGSNTSWSGAYTDVDEMGISDADFISGGSNGDKESFTTSARATISPLEVKAIGVSARALRDVTGPQNMDLMVRNGSSEHFQPITGLTTSYSHFQYAWHLDPDTGNIWSNADAENASFQFGVRAVT